MVSEPGGVAPVTDQLLDGLRVLELSTRASGAYAGRLLAAMGASVDRIGPALELNCSPEVRPEVESWFHDRKRLMTLDPLDTDIPDLTNVDIVVIEADAADSAWQDFAARLTKHAEHESTTTTVVVSAAILNGKPLPGEALTAGAWSAVSWSMGDADKAPLTLPFDVADFQVAVWGCAAALAAVLAEPADSSLRNVEVAGRDILAYYTGMITANFLPYERPWAREGARPPGSAGVYPASIFACSDGHVVLMCRNQKEWHLLLEAMGNPEWSKDPRFEDPRVVARLHADEADSHLIPWIASHTVEDLVTIGRAAGLAVAPIRSMTEALDEPQFAHRGFLEARDPASPVRTAGVPWQLAETTQDDQTTPRSWSVGGATRADGLFKGLRVLDLSWVWSGPLTTSVMGDLGAEVLKIEHAGHMDTGRQRGPARRNGVEVSGPGHEATPYFNQMNHGKRSITVDMKQPEAKEILLDLVRHCDIVVENMRPGVLERLGLGYEDFAAANPAVVMLSMSMAGQSGPLSTMKGYAGIMSAMSGLEGLIGYDKDNIVGSLSPAIGDPNAAGHALTVLMAALIRRRKTGRGSWIDLSQIEALVSVLPSPIVMSQRLASVEVPVNTHLDFVPHGHFPCAGTDAWVALAVRSDEDWSSLVEFANENSLRKEQWATSAGRTSDRERLESAIANWTRGHERDELVQSLLDLGIAAAPVASFEEMSASEWREDRRLTVTVDHRYLGPTDVYVVPWKFGGESVGVALPAPLLGADTEDVLKNLLGLSSTEIQRLSNSGVLR